MASNTSSLHTVNYYCFEHPWGEIYEQQQLLTSPLRDVDNATINLRHSAQFHYDIQALSSPNSHLSEAKTLRLSTFLSSGSRDKRYILKYAWRQVIYNYHLDCQIINSTGRDPWTAGSLLPCLLPPRLTARAYLRWMKKQDTKTAMRLLHFQKYSGKKIRFSADLTNGSEGEREVECLTGKIFPFLHLLFL